MIKTVDLKKYYEKNRGVENLNLTVNKGEIYGFIGPNGAGKSTTIRMLLGFIRPTGGEAYLFGEACTNKNLVKLKERIGYLPSEVDYYDNMRVGELLKYSAKYYKKDCSSNIQRLCEYFNLDQKKPIEDLSYGNRKKVAIVQTLMHEPELLILDEPTGGLDPLMQHRFFELLQQEQKKGATIFFSSHILSEVQKLCHRVGVIKEGSLILVQNMDELQRTRYKKVKLTLTQAEIFATLHQHIKDLHQTGNEVSFIFEGEVPSLMQLLGGINITDIGISEPDLEEIFMHYYQEEDLR